MDAPILATKLFIPPPQPGAILRPRLMGRLQAGLHRKLTLVSAPAGFGKTSLISEWLSSAQLQAAWLSLDEDDNDPTRFLTYLVAAVQSVLPSVGTGLLKVLQSPQPPTSESILTTLLNDIATLADVLVLVLDDYHRIDAKTIDAALIYLVEHLPPQMHIVITTREDPQLPLARLRARGQLTELRAADLRFTSSESAEFLNRKMGLNLSANDVDALETRTEGWVAGLQLAAISMQGQNNTSRFIESFTGSHHFVLDYLVEEVFQQQPPHIQNFLLHTSILDRMCGSLCEAVLNVTAPSGQEMLKYLERANLFMVPLDNERRWYRYHHLFGDLLRQRLQQSSAAMPEQADLHIRASVWYEANGLELEAFHHAAAANDIERVERLIEGDGTPLQFRGAAAPVRNWLASLTRLTLDARPSLWVTYASTLLFGGLHTGAEQKLQAAEAALQNATPDAKTADLIGRIASMRATLAIIQHDVEAIITQSRRALEYLPADNLPIRAATTYTLEYAYQTRGDRSAASQAYADVIASTNSLGESIYTIAATIGLAQIQETENQLRLATKTYHRVLQLAGDPPDPIACEAFLGLARIAYQWNDLATAEQHGQSCLHLTQQMESVDTFSSHGLFLARLKLAQGDVSGAAAVLAEAEAYVRLHHFVHQLPLIAAVQVLTLLHQGDFAAADALAEAHELPASRARVHLAQGEPSAALLLLEPLCRQVEAQGLIDERLRLTVLMALAHHASGAREMALQSLSEALTLATPGGFIRVFVDEGLPMGQLLAAASAHGLMPDYTARLLDALHMQRRQREDKSLVSPAQPLIDGLSQRELEVLQLMADGLSNHEIGERLFLAVSTIKGHNRNIFDKLHVQRRTEAVARAHELGIL